MPKPFSFDQLLDWQNDFRQRAAAEFEKRRGEYDGPRAEELRADEVRCTEVAIVLGGLCNWGTIESIRGLLETDLAQYIESREPRFQALMELGGEMGREASRHAEATAALRRERESARVRLPGDEILNEASRLVEAGLAATGTMYKRMTDAANLLRPVVTVIRNDRTWRRVIAIGEGVLAFLVFNIGFEKLKGVIDHAAESVNRPVPVVGVSLAFLVSLATAVGFFVLEDRFLTPWYEERLDRWTRRHLSKAVARYYADRTTLEYQVAQLELQVSRALAQAKGTTLPSLPQSPSTSVFEGRPRPA